ncbi:MAG: DegV family protein [Anaerolineae bacterium]|nr:DegV family protein [Anaerolineae bacterium]
MASITIVSDTIPNFPLVVVAAHRLRLVPVYVTFGSETVRDYYDLSSTAFYERLTTSPDFPTTSQPPVSECVELYQNILSETPDTTILSIHISSRLSGTVESARQAASQFPNADIRIIDTFTVGIGQALMVLEAAAMAEAGEHVETIVTRMLDMRRQTSLYFALDTLDYLARGGRIGRAARLFGTLLDMKPILTLKEGAVEAFDRQRTRDRAIDTLRRLARDECWGKKGVRLAVAHAAVPIQAQRLADELDEEIKPETLFVSEISAALGTHTGPGALGVGWYIPPQE